MRRRQGKDIMSARDIRNSLEKLKADSGRVHSAVSDLLAKVDAMPVEPDVYEQIRERYGAPFSDLKAPDGHFFLMDGELPVYRKADTNEWWLGLVDRACVSPSPSLHLILRPAKRIVFVEDPGGEFSEHGCGVWKRYSGGRSTATRYRREEAVNAG